MSGPSNDLRGSEQSIATSRNLLTVPVEDAEYLVDVVLDVRPGRRHRAVDLREAAPLQVALGTVVAEGHELIPEEEFSLIISAVLISLKEVA